MACSLCSKCSNPEVPHICQSCNEKIVAFRRLETKFRHYFALAFQTLCGLRWIDMRRRALFMSPVGALIGVLLVLRSWWRTGLDPHIVLSLAGGAATSGSMIAGIAGAAAPVFLPFVLPISLGKIKWYESRKPNA